MQLIAKDGTRIVYDSTQPAETSVLLLAGFGSSRQVWHDLGHVEGLSQTHRVITMDMRGEGDSGKPLDAGAYSVEHHIDDIHGVMDACGVEAFMVWGHSFGGTLGYHLAARSNRVLRVLLSGTYFANVMAEPWVQDYRQQLIRLAQMKAEGRLNELSEEERQLIAENDLEVLLTRLEGLRTWPMVRARDLLCPTCFYSGTRDVNVVATLEKQRSEIEAAGHRVRIFDDLDHEGLVAAIEVVGPLARSFFGNGRP